MTERNPGLDVLIVEDSETDTKLIVRELRASGFSPSWERVDDISSLREALSKRSWQLVISDSSVPRLGTTKVLATVKELAPKVPFIVVSGTITEQAAVDALRGGAADYVTKERLGRLGPAVARELSGAAAREHLSHGLLAAQEAERRRVAAGLHDQLGELLTALRLRLDSLGALRGAARTAAVAEARTLVDEAMAQTRDLSVELWPAILDDVGLAAALRHLVDRHARWSGLAFSLELDALDCLPFAVEVACFRIAQQALTNVERHAGARAVEIRLQARGGAVELSVSDDGRGFDVASALERAAAEGNLGLLGMQERASLAGGRLTIDSTPNGGTRVHAHFWASARTKR